MQYCWYEIIRINDALFRPKEQGTIHYVRPAPGGREVIRESVTSNVSREFQGVTGCFREISEAFYVVSGGCRMFQGRSRGSKGISGAFEETYMYT